eukprot:CAMPEP_0177589312 /NCGR_PEP_ID=MMETSP0419_2-20121207/6731_1 /TAXON_ID=582737 /ORGANISM="Tetraselmis sp., Strain GSL018" /LENGTH=199 /DNA_ID=CAMNT_0019079647 /DNA_START=538 /DNA_END=1135 /DNA_ORIENTATION=+
MEGVSQDFHSVVNTSFLPVHLGEPILQCLRGRRGLQVEQRSVQELGPQTRTQQYMRLIKTADGSEETASAGAGNSEKATSNLQHIHGRKFSRIDEVLAAYGKRSGTQNVSCEAAPAQPETQDPPTAELRSEPVGAPASGGRVSKAGGSVSGAPPGGGGGALDALKRLRRGHRFGRREQRGPAQHDSASDASAGGREEHA